MKNKVLIPILIITLLLTSGITAIATTSNHPSPTKPKEYTITIINTRGGTGTQKDIPNADSQIKLLIATPKNGYTFYKWRISGDYEIIKGSLTSSSLYIRLLSDCTAIPYYTFNKTSVVTKTKYQSNISMVSPKTAKAKDIPLITGLSVIVLIILILVIFEIRKFIKNKTKIRHSKH